MSPSRPPAVGLFHGLFSRGAAAEAVSEGAMAQAMVDVELALIRALVRAGLAPAAALDDLEVSLDPADLAALGRSAGEHGTPVPALVQAMRERLGDDAAAVLHRGATSQDIVDTALMLVARRALGPVLEDFAAAADRCAELAEIHRDTVQIGRTLLQQAVPLPFGLVAAGWLVDLDAARSELSSLRATGLAVQLGGAVGTLAPLGDRGVEVVADVAAQLSLADPELPWHTNRFRPVRLAAAVGLATGVLAKIARDVTLYAQTEVSEVAAGDGGSSTMPHKRNPVDAIAVLACAQRIPGLVATLLGAMTQEYQRAAGAWQAESETLLDLLRLAGSAAAAARAMLDGLEVDPLLMRANLELTSGLVMSESVAAALGDVLGRARAQDLLREAAAEAARSDRPLRDVLLELPDITGALDPAALDRALDPARYLGVAGAWIDRALAGHREIP
jgi:3-carboxy-cis,cis-muconate cycloisomerase